MSDGDGIEEAFDGALRTSIAVASRVAERLMRMREEAARRAEAASVQQAREYQARLEAERAVARAELAPVHEASWWDRAGTEDIARAYETATVWSVDDEEARRAGDRIREEMQARYGVDVGSPGADPTAVRDALAMADGERDLASAERTRAVEEQAEAQQLLERAERVDERAEQEHREVIPTLEADELCESAAREWDSSERREAHAAELEGKASKESIDAWKQADSDNAKHPRETVRRASGSTPKARRTRAGGDRERQRGRGAETVKHDEGRQWPPLIGCAQRGAPRRNNTTQQNVTPRLDRCSSLAPVSPCSLINPDCLLLASFEIPV